MTISLVRYGVAAVAAALVAAAAGFALPGAARMSFWAGAGLAVAVQAACFALLGRAAGSRRGFLAAWAAGTGIRVGSLVLFGLWGARALGLEHAPALIGMGAMLFVLLLLEPVGLRGGLGAARA